MNRKFALAWLFIPVLILNLLATAVRPASAAAAERGAAGVVLLDDLKLRAGPGFASRVLRLLEEGQKLTVVGRSTDGYWLEVRLRDRTGGWVFASYVRMDVKASSLPITEASGGPDGSSGGDKNIRAVYVTIASSLATVKLEGFPKNKELIARLGLPGKGAALEVARGTTSAGGSLSLTFRMPKTWPDGKAVTQNQFLLEISSADQKVKQAVDVVYYR